MIILSDDIIFRKAVIHLLNVELGKFAPAQDLFMMQPDVIELVRKQVCYLLNSDELKAADWNTKEPGNLLRSRRHITRLVKLRRIH